MATKDEPNKGKAKRRPLKLMKTNKVADKSQATYNINAAHSPLLRLPSEVRNRIWHFLFGGKTVHVTATNAKTPLYRHLCSVAESEFEVAEGIKEHEDPGHYHSHSRRRYLCASCEPASHRKLPFDALQVCRQTHKEAALMPYAENTFSLGTPASLEKFLKSIAHVQARSISSISILYNWTYSRKMTLVKLTQHKLQNVKNLVNFLELDAGITARNFVYSVGTNAGMALCAQRFNLPKLESATVAVSFPAPFDGRQPAASVLKAKMTTFEQEAERQLVVSGDV